MVSFNASGAAFQAKQCSGSYCKMFKEIEEEVRAKRLPVGEESAGRIIPPMRTHLMTEEESVDGRKV